MIAIIVISWMAISVVGALVVGRGLRLRDEHALVRVPTPAPAQAVEVPEKILV